MRVTFVAGTSGPWRISGMRAPRHVALFDELLAALRATEEWTWVERETEVRLERDPLAAATAEGHP